MSSSITSSSPPKRRLSLFSFGNKKNSNSKNNIIGNDNNNTPPSSQSQEQQSQDELNDQQQQQQQHHHNHNQKRFNPDDKARGPHDTDIQLVSPNSPLSLTDENLQNLQNLNNINSLPPPSMSLGTITPTSNSNTQHHHNHHHPHQQQQHSKSVSDTMSESSLIFERYVQDPFPTSPQIPLPQQQQQQQQQQQSQQSLPNQPLPQRQNSQFFGAPHLTNENFIPLAIDSTTSLIQSNTDLDEVDMIYSPRRSSVLNLSSAFNSPQQPSSRRSSVATNYNANKSPALDRSMSLFTTTTSSQQPPSKSLQPALKQRKSTISFLSYADMIQNEEQDQNIPRRPSMSQTLSSSFLLGPNIPRSRNDSITSSRTPLRQPALFTASPSISRQTSGRSSMMNKLNTQQQQPQQQKFQLMPDSPTSESSDNDEMMLPNSKARSLSNASSSHNNGATLCTTKTIDDVLETPEPNEQEPHDIVVSSVGDTLRQYTEDIRSS